MFELENYKQGGDETYTIKQLNIHEVDKNKNNQESHKKIFFFFQLIQFRFLDNLHKASKFFQLLRFKVSLSN